MVFIMFPYRLGRFLVVSVIIKWATLIELRDVSIVILKEGDIQLHLSYVAIKLIESVVYIARYLGRRKIVRISKLRTFFSGILCAYFQLRVCCMCCEFVCS